MLIGTDALRMMVAASRATREDGPYGYFPFRLQP